MSLSVLSVIPPSLSLTTTGYSLPKKSTQSTLSVSRVTATTTRVAKLPEPAYPAYPPFPDVSLKKLPFYRVVDTLLKPSTLQPMGKGRSSKSEQQNLTFYLTPAQVTRITNSRYRSEKSHQIQLRFSLLETTSDQVDNFPTNVSVKVNGKPCSLPNTIAKPNSGPKKLPGSPVNITPLCKLSSTTSNTVTVSWAVEWGRAYTVSIYEVENLSHKDLLEQLKKKGQRQPEYTKALIKQKLSDSDQEISTTSCKVSLACPLGKMRMNTPCRASTCDHLQCFDAELYLMMNEKKAKWMCPVCNKSALMENLLIDGFFQNLVRSPRLTQDQHEIVLHSDGTWDPSNIDKEATKHNDKPVVAAKKVIYIGQKASKRPLDDLNNIVTLGAPSKKLKVSRTPSNHIECIDID